jgi:hypothetical protein
VKQTVEVVTYRPITILKILIYSDIINWLSFPLFW